ncbi:MAG: DUF1501 domain-containing protein, partial [Bacteroidota bacterium]
KYSRRSFITKLSGGCASVGITSALAGITNMGLMNAAAAANHSILAPQNTYKALVCIMFAGGNDSYNMLIPRGNAEYNEYATIRTNLAIPQNQILPLNPLNNVNRELGLHPNMPGIKQIFDNGDLAFISNVGALVEPLTKASYNSKLKPRPIGLFSHSDQQKHWQTSVPQDRRQATGWGGRLADIMYSNNSNQNISMNIAVDNGNIFQKGQNALPYVIRSGGNGGSVVLNGSSSNNFYETLKRQTLDNMLDATYQNILEKGYTNSVQNAIGSSFEFNSAITNAPALTTVFPDTSFGRKLRVTAKTIAARNLLNVSHQTFFVQIGGFDNHGDINDHSDRMAEVNEGLKAFYDALVEMGVLNDVTTFTISDFSRKLISNGSGSDHAWGGHVMVMGGAVDGQKIYGDFPDLAEGSDRVFGGGRVIPTTSCDEYYAELALWFGASSSDLYQILPNISNFWLPTSGSNPIGFMS